MSLLFRKNVNLENSNYRPVSVCCQLFLKNMRRLYQTSLAATLKIFLILQCVHSGRGMDVKLLYYAWQRTGNMLWVKMNMLLLCLSFECSFSWPSLSVQWWIQGGGVRGVQTNPLWSLNYFIFTGNVRKN